MISLRLPKELEDRLDALSKQEHVTKSIVVREAIEEYLVKRQSSVLPYESGKDLFGKYGSENGKLSKEYKNRIKEKLREKMSR